MIRSFVVGFLVAWFLAINCEPMVAQQAAPSSGVRPRIDQVPESSVPQVPLAGGNEEFKLPPELQAEADAAVANFMKLRGEFERAIADQRATQIRFLNGEDRTPAAQERYRQQRDEARRLMDETYLAAMQVFLFMPDDLAGQYMATVIQHRAERDIYDLSTAEGGARLIDAGLNYLYLFQAAARSAVVAGDFKLAKQLFDALDPETVENVDLVLAAQLEQLESDYNAEQQIREKESVEDRLPRVKLKTTRGDVVLELFIDNAPSTVSNFIQLVESGFYDGLDFYQVIDHLLALTGDPSGLGTGNSGRMLVDEHTRPDARKAFRGSLIMAKVPIGTSGKFVPNSASSQFAILFLPMTQVSSEQTVFGRVIEGMNVISSMRRVDPSKEKDKKEIVLPPDRILSAEVIRRPETLPPANYVE